jgi:hypothetical protein
VEGYVVSIILSFGSDADNGQSKCL